MANKTNHNNNKPISDLGERMIPTQGGEVSFVFSRHLFAYRYLLPSVSNKSVLDIGCGTGYGSYILSGKAVSVVAVDYDKDAIDYCREHYQNTNLKYLEMDAKQIELNEKFDIIVSFQMIEHLTQPKEFLVSIKRLLKSNGLVFISTPNVQKPDHEKNKNPFHHHEMNDAQFRDLLSGVFTSVEILGITYASENKLRKWLGKMPFYKWGRYLKRNSKIKKIAGQALSMTEFKVVTDDIVNSADLLAICHI
ncbi:methyltransferase domain-containing protein [candidate division KSB1 bacterium]|nr:methyltransferase domain-containing protein [candidate division KSB1 bacterium]